MALLLLWLGDHSLKLQWTLTLLILGFWLAFTFSLRERVIFPLQTLANLLDALRNEDFSIRARRTTRDDALDAVYREVNALGETLRSQRLGAVEASALLRTVMEEIDVAVFTFDGAQRLRLVNRAGERLLAQPAARLLDRSAAELGLADCLDGDPVRTLERTFPGGTGRWGVRRTTFREEGRVHHLLVMADLSKALREEERQAWQRLIRVLGHELNNSLAPIKSMAATLKQLVHRSPRADDWEEDMESGLRVIEERAAALSRFMVGYSRLAHLPPPTLEPVDVGETVNHVAALETRVPVRVHEGPELPLLADRAQLEQLLINLVRNATDAALEVDDAGGEVELGWAKIGGYLELRVDDRGPGLANPSNLFVPFFTTKPGGSGIGLVLSRQIAEAHGGTLTIENRRPGPGCRVRLRLPLARRAEVARARRGQGEARREGDAPARRPAAPRG